MMNDNISHHCFVATLLSLTAVWHLGLLSHEITGERVWWPTWVNENEGEEEEGWQRMIACCHDMLV
jgi:hypothetical protein